MDLGYRAHLIGRKPISFDEMMKKRKEWVEDIAMSVDGRSGR